MPKQAPFFEDDDDLLNDLSSADGEVDEAEPVSRKSRSKKARAALATMEAEAGDDLEVPSSGGYTLDDIGNADRLAAAYGGEMKHLTDLDQWAVWEEEQGRWLRDEKAALRRSQSVANMMRSELASELKRAFGEHGSEKAQKKAKAFAKHVAQSRNLGRMRSGLAVASSYLDMTAMSSDFDFNPRLMHCPNGVLEFLSTGARFRTDFRQTDMCSMTTGTVYDKDAVNPKWDAYLETFFPNIEIRRWAQKVAGASLFGSNYIRKIVFALGSTTCGKGMFAEVVMRTLGEYASPFRLSLLRESQDERPRADLANALPKRIVFADEASGEWRLHADMVKNITGGGPISCRMPHSGMEIVRVPAFTPWVLCNHTPTIDGHDAAIDHRLLVIPFEVSMKANDNPQVKLELLESDLSGVLAWLVEGWDIYCREGLGDPPVAAIEATMRVREDLSDFDRFLAEVTDKAAEYVVRSGSLTAAYDIWCDANRIPERDRLTGHKFGRKLTDFGFENSRTKIDGKTAAVRTGLRLKAKWVTKVERMSR